MCFAASRRRHPAPWALGTAPPEASPGSYPGPSAAALWPSAAGASVPCLSCICWQEESKVPLLYCPFSLREF